jgi:hypothetical protein
MSTYQYHRKPRTGVNKSQAPESCLAILVATSSTVVPMGQIAWIFTRTFVYTARS